MQTKCLNRTVNNHVELHTNVCLQL